jgi:5-deoxy-glucuronate isomerase
MNLRLQASGREGYEVIIDNHEALKYINHFGILRLVERRSFSDHTDSCEALLHVIEGSCTINVNGEPFAELGSRATPYEGRPAAVYLPPGVDFSVEGEGVEIAITRSHAEANGEPQLIAPESLQPKQAGKDNWARTVTMIAPPDYPAQKLILGETVNPPGNWSGVPTHKHDSHAAGEESMHEELYYFRVDRPGGWGIERVYDKNGLDEVLLLQDRVVTLKPRGFHTVSAAPGYTLYYAFMLAGPSKKLIARLDPDQAWISD